MSNIFQNIKQKGRDLVRDVYFLLDSYNPKKKKGIYTYNWWNDKKDDIWLWRFIKNKFPEKVNRVNLFSCFSRIVKGIKYYKWINIFIQEKIYKPIFLRIGALTAIIGLVRLILL